MQDVPFPTSSNPGSAPGEGSGRLINCFAYKDGAGARWRPSAGLTELGDLPAGDVRGGLLDTGLVTLVVGNRVLRIDGGGGVASVEENVPGDGPVTMARNNNTQPVTAICSSNGAFYISNNVVMNYPGLPTVNSLSFLDGYFLWTTKTGRIVASALNDITIDPLSFVEAQIPLLRGVSYAGQFYAFGTEKTKVYQDAGTLPFPLSYSTTIPIGLAGPWSIAGYEDGWAGPLIFVAQDNSVRLLNGADPTRISNEDLERQIGKVTDRSTLRASVYTAGGNAFWVISCPDFTWEYNVTTGEWNERASYDRARWRGGITIRAFGKWIVADERGGALYTIDPEARTEAGDPLIWGMDSGPVKNFPARIAVTAGYFDFVLGQASDPLMRPQAMISWSRDGGGAWAQPVTRSLQKQGQFFGRVPVFRMGLSSHHGTRVRFRVSDPVYSSFAGARLEASARR